jgi:hypothetical protein
VIYKISPAFLPVFRPICWLRPGTHNGALERADRLCDSVPVEASPDQTKFMKRP